jgi:hypothetical protein
MKTNIVMKVTPEQSRKVQEIAIAQGANWYRRKTIKNTDMEQLFIEVDKLLTANGSWADHQAARYEEVDAELFIRTNGTCEEWTPEPGEMIMVWNVNEDNTAKREFITMTKDGKGFICYNITGTSCTHWPNAKPAPKDWTELVSEGNMAICWVWDVGDEDKTVVLIKEVNEKEQYCYRSKVGIDWDNAKFIMWAKDAE